MCYVTLLLFAMYLFALLPKKTTFDEFVSKKGKKILFLASMSISLVTK